MNWKMFISTYYKERWFRNVDAGKIYDWNSVVGRDSDNFRDISLGSENNYVNFSYEL